MKEIQFEFVELDSDASFQRLGSAFGGILKHSTLHFNNPVVKGELTKTNLEEGLWIRKWKLTVFQNVILRRLLKPVDQNVKFSLIYFLNPSIFNLTHNHKKVIVNSQHSNVFLSNEVTTVFNVIPKQPFYVLDITFTASWLLQQFDEKDPCYDHISNFCSSENTKTILTEPCTTAEFKILQELEEAIQSDNKDILFTRSRIYNLICSFFDKALNKNEAKGICNAVRYEEIVKAKKMIMENLKALPKVETIAKSLNMSVSSLLRQFKIMYGKSIHDYYIEKKMELAKKLMLEENKTVKEIALMLGYNQASPFIEAFSKLYGYSPGSLKTYR
jgi:AraC-like DNA-binding protein